MADLRHKAQARTSQRFPIITIQVAGLDGFWIHRVLEDEGIERTWRILPQSPPHVVAGEVNGEALVQVLLAYKRCEPRICAMVRAPTPQEEDRRRTKSERKALTVE